MSKPIIEVRNLSKLYHVGQIGHTSFRDLAERWMNRLRGRSSGAEGTGTGSHKHMFSAEQQGPEPDSFWSLKDISFDVQPGEVVGIIGRNGAGKSTLLKILSRITEPTTGEIKLRGRVASLLEVGTGFHPELTGRENIYLNGAILGMTRAEIRKKFDEIVAFAEVENFIDTPVKRYSSGMYVRLAFAVAAHLEPEILVVDEVLAVGDAQFQKKCLGKMQDVSRNEGRTVLFVSHNMEAIERLCSEAILLKQGKIALRTHDIREVTKAYHQAIVIPEIDHKPEKVENDYFMIDQVTLKNLKGDLITCDHSNDEDIILEIKVVIKQSDPALAFGIAVYDEDNHTIFWSFNTDIQIITLDKGHHTLIVKIPAHILNEGIYTVEIISSVCFVKWLLEPGHSVLRKELSIKGGLSKSAYWTIRRPGFIAPHLQWQYRSGGVH